MTLLFAGSEPEAFDFVDAGLTWATTSAASFDANYARGYMQIRSAKALGIDLGADQTEVWVGLYAFTGAAGNGTNNITLETAAGENLAAVTSPTSSTFASRYATSATAFTNISPTGPRTSTTKYRLLLHYKKVATNQALIEFYQEDVLISSATITHAWQGTKLPRWVFIGGGSGSSFPENISEVIITDSEDPRGWRVSTLAPNANGATNDWAGTYVDIDELGPPEDTDYISSDTAGQVELFGLSNLSVPAQNMGVRAVLLSARSRKGDTGPQNIQPLVRTGGVDYAGADLPGLTSAFLAKRTIWDVNPATGIAWTVSEIQALEAGFKSLA